MATARDTWAMAMDELTDAVVWKRAAILAPSQCEAILKALRRAKADKENHANG
jgi:hypothetical protein